MPAQWAAVETLIRDLGGVRAASFAAYGHVTDAGKAAIEQGIAEATEAVVATLNAPQDAEVLGRAREAIEVVSDVLATLDAELVRSRRLRVQGAELRRHAKELIEQAARR